MKIQNHLRNAFLTGIFAAIPLAVTAFVLIAVERGTRKPMRELLGIDTPFVGILLAIALIYVLGVAVNSLLGRLFLRAIDRLLSRVPVLKDLYQAWKQVTLTPGGKEGIFAKVVLVAAEDPEARLLGFTSGDSIAGDPNMLCVFVPAAPNPINGRLYFVPRTRCKFLDITVEEAFKVLLSTGNYFPKALSM